jgi:hypothetical protein
MPQFVIPAVRDCGVAVFARCGAGTMRYYGIAAVCEGGNVAIQRCGFAALRH